MGTTQERTDGGKVSVEEMARSISAAIPTLDVTDQQIALATYRLLGSGKPVATETIAAEVGVPVARVEAALESWPGVYRDDAGSVAGFWGLAIEPLDPEYSAGGGRQRGARGRPPGAVVSMVIPDGPFGYDVIESFCHKVLFSPLKSQDGAGSPSTREPLC